MRFDQRKGLDAVKVETIALINQQAGEVRAKYITVAPGQEMTYMEKRREAEAIMADLEIPESQTPNLRREAAADNVSRYEKAVEILTMAYQWAELSSLIEDRRLGACKSINAATTVAEVRLAGTVDWKDL